jgi:hypothetical protein
MPSQPPEILKSVAQPYDAHKGASMPLVWGTKVLVDSSHPLRSQAYD